MRVLTLHQPWAWLIMYGGKDLENRPSFTSVTGPVLVHAGLKRSDATYACACGYLATAQIGKARKLTIPHPDTLQYGGIVGVMRLGKCVSFHDSPWFVGPWAYPVEETQILPFTPCLGKQGFWKIPTVEYFKMLKQQMDLAEGEHPDADGWYKKWTEAA